MSKPKGKTPSLLGSSLGKVEAVTAKKKCQCSRCDAELLMGDRCFDVQQPNKPFNSTRRFCATCFKNVLAQTKLDLAELEGQALV
jgi:hypothetical protein